MAFDLADKLVLAVASSAMFDLGESDQVFRKSGVEEYRKYQMERENEPFKLGPAAPFIRRVLSFNSTEAAYHPVEVVLLSRNDAETGLRVMNSLEHYGIPISRAAFLRGESPVRYMDSYNADLFLTENDKDVRQAIESGKPAGLIMHGSFPEMEGDDELRIAFDFDGILAGDSAERVFKKGTLEDFHTHESRKADVPLEPGPLKPVIEHIAKIQQHEFEITKTNPDYKPRIRTAIITARNAPAHKRAIRTLRSWNISVDQFFLMGGVSKAGVLREFKPHIYFDDQETHLADLAGHVPAVHVPYGVANMTEKPDR